MSEQKRNEKSKKNSVLYGRKINQDHVKHLHSLIRGYNGYDDHPDVFSYVKTIRCLACQYSTSELIETHSLGANCESSSWEESLPSAPTSDVDSGTSRIHDGPTNDAPLHDPSPTPCKFVPLNELEKETTVYISGSVCRKLMKLPRYDECLAKFLSETDPTTTFSLIHKNYQPDALLNTCINLREFIKLYEGFFKGNIEEALTSQNPKKYLLSLFYDSPMFSDLSHFACTTHNISMLSKFLNYYTDIRMFQEIKLFNQKLLSTKKGNELNKDRKLNM